MTKKLTDLTEVTSTEDGDLLLIRDATDGVDKKMQAQNLRAKATTKDDVGLGSVPNLDTTEAVNKAHDQNTDTALDQGGANEVTATDARAHIDSTANPHGVTKTQVGLGDVDNVSAADLRDRSTHTGTQTLSTISDAGTIASQDANSVNIDGGTIDGTAVNATTLTASGDANFDSGTLFVDASADAVGIGTTSPVVPLHVFKDISDNSVEEVARFTGTTNSGLFQIKIGRGVGTNLRNTELNALDIDGSTFRDMQISSRDLFLFTGINPTERMRIDSSGHAIIPAGVTLGTSAGVYNAANTLDDYETGTWTPTVFGGSTRGTYTTSNIRAYYTKIGNQVTVWGQFGFSAASGGSGLGVISGLPFNYKANSAGVGAILVKNLNTSNATSNGISIQPSTSGSNTQLFLALTLDNASSEEVSITAFSISTFISFTFTYTVS